MRESLKWSSCKGQGWGSVCGEGSGGRVPDKGPTFVTNLTTKPYLKDAAFMKKKD